MTPLNTIPQNKLFSSLEETIHSDLPLQEKYEKASKIIFDNHFPQSAHCPSKDCSMTLKRKMDYLEHINSKHIKYIIAPCLECPNFFYSFKGLRRHQKNHEPQGSVKELSIDLDKVETKKKHPLENSDSEHPFKRLKEVPLAILSSGAVPNPSESLLLREDSQESILNLDEQENVLNLDELAHFESVKIDEDELTRSLNVFFKHHDLEIEATSIPLPALADFSQISSYEVSKVGPIAFVNKSFSEGDEVMVFSGKTLFGNTQDLNNFLQETPQQVFSHENVLLIPTEHSQQLLHSSQPNLRLVKKIDGKSSKWSFIAKRDIQPNEPLTIKYPAIKAREKFDIKPEDLNVHIPVTIPHPETFNEFSQTEHTILLNDGSTAPLKDHPLVLDKIKNLVKLRKIPSFSDLEVQQFKKLKKSVSSKGLPDNLTYGQLPFGCGVFLKNQAKKINKGDVVGFYTGTLRVSLSNNRRNLPTDYAFSFFDFMMDKETILEFIEQGFLPEDNQQYILERDQTKFGCFMDLDSEKEGNYSRFFNHSSHSHNLELKTSHIDGVPYVIFVANQNIEPGSQLLFNYGKEYWKPRDFKPLPLKPDSHLN